MKNLIKRNIYVLILTILPSIYLSIRAQSYYSDVESKIGYWQVYTNPGNKTTVVQFFDASRQVIYEETMPRKYIKLNKSNIARFDELLHKLTSRNLVASSIKSYELVGDSRTAFRGSPGPAPVNEPNYIQTTQSKVYVTKEGKLKIILKNPSQQQFNIMFLDEASTSIYREQFDDTAYGRWFDMTKLPEGSYRIKIEGPVMRLSYVLKVDDLTGFSLKNLR